MDNTRRQVYMPATIVVARGLLSPMPVYGWRFSTMGERVKTEVGEEEYTFFVFFSLKITSFTAVYI